jgi:hypothetical protein
MLWSTLVKRWSNAGQTLVNRRSNASRTRAGRGPNTAACWSNARSRTGRRPGPTRVEHTGQHPVQHGLGIRRPNAFVQLGQTRVRHMSNTPAERWSNAGPTRVKRGAGARPNAGQTLVKYWSSARRGRAARAQRVTGRSTRGGSWPARGRQKPCGADPGQGGRRGGGKSDTGRKWRVRCRSKRVKEGSERGLRSWSDHDTATRIRPVSWPNRSSGRTIQLVKPFIWSNHSSGQTTYPGQTPHRNLAKGRLDAGLGMQPRQHA